MVRLAAASRRRPRASRTGTGPTSPTPSRQGTLGSYIDTHSSAAVLADPAKSKVVGKVGFARWPKGPSGRRVTSIWNWSFPINASVSDKEKAAAWLFIQWAGSKEMQAATSYGFDGAYKRLGVNRTSHLGSPEFTRRCSTASAPASPRRRSSLDPGGHRRRLAAARAAVAGGRRDVATAVQAALVGQATPKAALDAAQARGRRDHEAVTVGRGHAEPQRARRRRAALRDPARVPGARRARADDDLPDRLPDLELVPDDQPRDAVPRRLRRPRQLPPDGRRPALLALAAADRDLHRHPPSCCSSRSASASRSSSCRSPAASGCFRIVAILPIVLAPVVVGLFWRTLMFAPELRHGRLRHPRPRPRHRSTGSARRRRRSISVIVIHTWQWTPFAFLVLLASLASLPPRTSTRPRRLDRAARLAAASATSPCR